jgi:hypothetical protein
MIHGSRIPRQVIENLAFHLLNEQFMLSVRHGCSKEFARTMPTKKRRQFS